MARVTVTSFTATRMLEIENSTVVSGRIEGNNLVLTTRDGTAIPAGNVRGAEGPRGEAGGVWDATSELKGAIQLAGNIGGTADEPKVVGELSAEVDASLAVVKTEFTHPLTNVVSLIEDNLKAILAQAREAKILASTSIIAKGRAKVHWSGSEAEYVALPLAERNDPGFIAEII